MTKKKRKIVHISEVLATGILEFILTLTNNIKSYEHVIIYKTRDLGFDKSKIRELFPSNVILIEWKNINRPIHFIKDGKAAVELYKYLKELKPSIVHLHSSKAGMIGRFIAPFIVPKNTIIYTPNGAPFARTDIPSYKKKIFQFFERLGASYSGKVVCVSPSESNLYSQIGVPSITINNGVSLQSKFLCKPIESPSSKVSIVTSGRIMLQKNPVLFNKIAEYYQSKNIEFIWIGDGELSTLLNAPNIKVTGWVSKKEVYRNLQTATIYLTTSTWEGLPFSALEAMNLELPLIAFNCVGNVDMVEHGKNGFLFRSFEEGINLIDQLIKDRLLLTKMGQYSKYLCQQHFSKSSMINQYLEIYNACLLEEPLSVFSDTYQLQEKTNQT